VIGGPFSILVDKCTSPQFVCKFVERGHLGLLGVEGIKEYYGM
jgi:hypothetical protein